MICAACAETVEVTDAGCPLCGNDPVLDGRYRLDAVLAHSSAGVSYRATRLDDSLLVRALVRDLNLQQDDPMLRSRQLHALDQPRLPRCIDVFELRQGERHRLWVVHDFVRGTSLAEIAQPLDKDELLATLDEATAMLAPLHARWPPLIHGALERSSMLRRASDGHLTLVDFDPLTCNPSPAVDLQALAEISAGLVMAEEPELARSLRQLLAGVSDAGEARRALRTLQQLRQTESAQAVTRRMSSDELARELGVDQKELGIINPAAESGTHARDAVAGEIGQRAEASGSSIPVARKRPKPRSKPIVPGRQYKKTQPPSDDAPIMRPEELSRELSAAQRVASEISQRQRTQNRMAQLTLILIIACVTAAVVLFAFAALR